ncbi:cobalamin adenosyltransferase [Clostridium tarantellae]|uniref:Cobalamin adenosyltransferase n=1 Tax=Clostridium tarantellae TaxID=39493 RepID=A0A6I1MIF4_9CLOT|nr:cobalamin adenosyltransferase [Clostridium tarantellae]MPQ42900.1 cobalamin adenosyltransferase [Clostridium tarantellae]
MGVLTENEIKRILSRNDSKELKEFIISKGQIITPSAKSYLSERNIVLKYDDLSKESEKRDYKRKKEEKVVEVKEIVKEVPVEVEKEYKYVTVFGAKLDEKPEHMTHLNGNLLVFKDHKRIILRGKIDSLEAKLLEAQLVAKRNGMPKLIQDLQEIIGFVRNLMRCEVLEEPVGEFKLQDMNATELREKSHHPKKYFGIGHFFPDYNMGEIVISLNSIRTFVRETELIAYEAFKGKYGENTREDIIKALNRLSSLLWIMMFKVRTNKYANK